MSNKESISNLSFKVFDLCFLLRVGIINDEKSDFKKKIISLIDSVERSFKIADINERDVKLAKFALVAFIDEIVINSNLKQKDIWANENLQGEMLHTQNAGEEFFVNVDVLLESLSDNSEIIELYYLCLELGFKGKFNLSENDGELDSFKKNYMIKFFRSMI